LIQSNFWLQVGLLQVRRYASAKVLSKMATVVKKAKGSVPRVSSLLGDGYHGMYSSFSNSEPEGNCSALIWPSLKEWFWKACLEKPPTLQSAKPTMYKEIDEPYVVLKTLTSGSFFGEYGCLTGGFPNLDVTVLLDCS
jgi:hypothetical protein